MTDIITQLVEALESMLSMHEEGATLHGLVGPTVASARAALSAAKGGGWQPIETAPKDGTVVIIGRAGDDNEIASVVTTGHWQEAEEDGFDYMGADAGFVDEHYQEFRPGRSFGNPSCMYEPTQPTHWMPFPNPPKESTSLPEAHPRIDPARFTHGHNGDSITIYMDGQPVHWVPVLRREPMTEFQRGLLVMENLGHEALAGGQMSPLDAFTLGIEATESHHRITQKEQG